MSASVSTVLPGPHPGGHRGTPSLSNGGPSSGTMMALLPSRRMILHPTMTRTVVIAGSYVQCSGKGLQQTGVCISNREHSCRTHSSCTILVHAASLAPDQKCQQMPKFLGTSCKAAQDNGVPVGVEVQASIGGVLAQEAEVLARPGPAEDAGCSLGRRRDDHIHPPYLPSLCQVVAEDVIEPSRMHAYSPSWQFQEQLHSMSRPLRLKNARCALGWWPDDHIHPPHFPSLYSGNCQRSGQICSHACILHHNIFRGSFLMIAQARQKLRHALGHLTECYPTLIPALITCCYGLG